MSTKCEKCQNRQVIVTESGTLRCCCLTGGLDFLCSIGKVDRHKPQPNEKQHTEGDGQN